MSENEDEDGTQIGGGLFGVVKLYEGYAVKAVRSDMPLR
jgi:hypothetical protein